jgi:hypothetical protein
VVSITGAAASGFPGPGLRKSAEWSSVTIRDDTTQREGAGPVYQAALELSAEEVEREAIAAAKKEVEPPRVSAWWWLLPPVGYLLSRRQRHAYRQDVMTALTRTQLEQLVRFSDKANAWIFIALGAFLVAIADTWKVRNFMDGRCGLTSW